MGQRVSWLVFAGLLVMAAVAWLGLLDPKADLAVFAMAAVAVGVAGATYDIVIDAYRIETLKPQQLGVGSGMSQYGWRIGSVAAGALALFVAASFGWTAAYVLCAAFALPAMLTGLVLGEPARHVVVATHRGLRQAWQSVAGPLLEFLRRRGAFLVLLFVLLHKIGDTLANLTVRLLLNDLGFSNEEIAYWDVGLGAIAYLVGIFIGGVLYARWGMNRSVLVAPGADGRVQPELRPACLGGPFERPAGIHHRLREHRQRHRWRGGGGLSVGIVQSGLHGHPVCAAVGGLQRGGPGGDRHHGRRLDRVAGLCAVLPAHHGDRLARRAALPVHVEGRPDRAFAR
ncbi:MFS transporter [Arenimonas daejeonensis]|uniref:MFS transporter n=1 Tax=Arenimonas daejeonensis TaxID=370777 RepID=UPI00223F0A0B|nr:MFS transporter [Arenimonas daejeonensis]